MHTVRLVTIVNAYMGHPEFDQKNYDYMAMILESISRKNFDAAFEALKSSTSAFHFYPDEYKIQSEFCKAIRIELAVVGKEHYHQEITHRIDYIFNSPHFNLFMPILLPAISTERHVVLNSDKLDEAIKFYSERGELFDVVIAGILVQINNLNKKMNTYGEGL